MTEIQISELSSFINTNLTDNFSKRKKENILKKYESKYHHMWLEMMKEKIGINDNQKSEIKSNEKTPKGKYIDRYNY